MNGCCSPRFCVQITLQVLIVKLKKVEAQAPFKQINGKLHLVDLAGSEDNRRSARFRNFTHPVAR